MPCGNQLHSRASGHADNRHQRYKTSLSNIAIEFAIELLHRPKEAVALAETSSRISTANRCEQGRTNAVAGYVGQFRHYGPIRKNLPVIIVTTRLIRGLVPSCDLKAFDFRCHVREQGLLDRSCQREIVLHAFKLTPRICFT